MTRAPARRRPVAGVGSRGLSRLFVALARLSDAYEEGFEIALARSSTGVVETGGRGWSDFEHRDPTGETAAVAWEPRHVRGAVRFIPKAIGRVRLEIERRTDWRARSST